MNRKLTYRELDGYKYELMKVVVVQVDLPDVTTMPEYIIIRNGLLVIRGNYAWDGPSGPTIDTPNFMRGSLVHDALYQLMRKGLLNRRYRKYTDQLLRKICIEDGMSKFRAWYVYHSVRIFAKQSSMPRKNPRGKIIEIEIRKGK